MRLPSPLFERGASAIPPLRPNPADDARAAGSHRRGGDDRIRTGDRGFADLRLATWPRRQRMERKTGFEPATFSLARRCSTAEPLPLGSRSMQLWCRGRDLNSYGRCPLPPQDSVSTYSTTSACLAGAEGLEPPTGGFGDHCSTKLSYTPTRCRGYYKPIPNAVSRQVEQAGSQPRMDRDRTPTARLRSVAVLRRRATAESICGSRSRSPAATPNPGPRGRRRGPQSPRRPRPGL